MMHVEPTVQATPPVMFAMRNFGYGIFNDPASGPAKIRNNAMNRPKNTAHTPYLVNTRSANATYLGPKCFGKRLPSHSNSGAPKRWPIAKPIESPTTAPAVAHNATHPGEIPKASFEDNSAAETNVISPGNGIPRLSTMITSATVRYTASGGIDCSSWSINDGSLPRLPHGADFSRADPRHARSGSRHDDLNATTPTSTPELRPAPGLGRTRETPAAVANSEGRIPRTTAARR